MVRPQKVEKDAANFPGAKLIVTKKAVKKSGAKKRKSNKSRKKVIKEIKELAKRTTPLAPRAAYARIFREIADEAAIENSALRWEKTAVDVLIAGTEAMLHDLMSSATTLTELRGAETLSIKDIKGVMKLKLK